MRQDDTLRRRAALLLALGRSETEAGAEVGRTRSTISRWKKQDSFRRLMADVDTEVRAELDRLRGRVAVGALRALDKMTVAIENGDVAASRALLGEACRMASVAPAQITLEQHHRQLGRLLDVLIKLRHQGLISEQALLAIRAEYEPPPN